MSARMGRSARVGGISPHEPQWECEPLAAYAPGARDNTDGYGGERLPGASVVVAGGAAPEARTPEARDVRSQRVVAVVLARLPQPLLPDEPGPARKQPPDRPIAPAQRRPSAPHRSHRQPRPIQTGDDSTARLQQPPAHQHPQQVQQPQVRPDWELGNEGA